MKLWRRNAINEFILADVERAVILLLNAIYFNGYWRRPFPENATIPSKFKTDLRNEIQTDFMDLTGDFFYTEDRNLDAKVIRLPYKVNDRFIVYDLPTGFLLNLT